MSRIDWRDLFAQKRVPFIEAGANVKRGELNCKCPFCGTSDPSFHLGINLESGYWACWRNSEHRGKSPVRLLMKLLRVSYQEALVIAGLDATYVDPEGFSALARRLREPAKEEARAEDQPLELPHGLAPLRETGPARGHWNYLDSRWFDPYLLADEYGVLAGIDGFFRRRVVFPYIEDNQLVTMTGRAVGAAEIRYKDLPLRPKEDYDGPIARIPAKETLFNHDCMLGGGRWLLIQEGPIDALKVDCYGAGSGVRSVALSTASISDEQLARLDAHASNFEHIGIMMDNARKLDVIHSMRMKSRVASVHRSTHLIEVPFGRKDGGELKPDEVRQFCRQLSARRAH